MAFPSDDDSLDGDMVFGDDTPEEGGGGDSEGGGADKAEKTSGVASPTEADNVRYIACM